MLVAAVLEMVGICPACVVVDGPRLRQPRKRRFHIPSWKRKAEETQHVRTVVVKVSQQISIEFLLCISAMAVAWLKFQLPKRIGRRIVVWSDRETRKGRDECEFAQWICSAWITTSALYGLAKLSDLAYRRSLPCPPPGAATTT